jgi:hypothetical protein
MRIFFIRCKGLKLLLFGLTVGLMFSTPVTAQQVAKTKTFVVIGTATVQGTNVSVARQKAISDGLVTAVALMTAELLQTDAVVENFSQLNELLFNQASTYIQDYKVLTEASSGKIYRVVVKATVSGGSISQRLSAAKVLKSQKPLPRVLLLIAEQDLAQISPGFWWGRQGPGFKSLAAAAMANRLQEAGFTIIATSTIRNRPLLNWEAYDQPDLTDQQAVELGSRLQADVVVPGTAIARLATNVMGSEMKSFNGTVSGRVIRVDSAEPLLPFTRTAVAVNEDDIIGSREALEDAGALAGRVLAEELTVAWQKEAGQPAVVQMLIRGTSNLASYVKFRKKLNTISGVQGIRVKEIEPNEATLLVEYKGKAKDLAAALMLQNFESFGINIFEVTWDTIKIELIPG